MPAVKSSNYRTNKKTEGKDIIQLEKSNKSAIFCSLAEFERGFGLVQSCAVQHWTQAFARNKKGWGFITFTSYRYHLTDSLAHS